MRSISTRTVLVVGLLVALTLAGFLSFHASSSPDGLNRVATDLGFAGAETASATQDGPLAGYDLAGVDHGRLSGGLAGVIGCLAVLGLMSVVVLVRQRSPRPARTRGE